MDLYYAGDYVASLQKLDNALAKAESFSKAKQKDMAILLATKAHFEFQLSDPKEADALLLRAQSLADQVLDASHPVTGRIQFLRGGCFFVKGDMSGAKLALERASVTPASGTNGLCLAMSLRGQALLSLVQGDPGQASLTMKRSTELVAKSMGTQSLPYAESQMLESVMVAATGEYEKALRLCESSLTILTNCVGPEHLLLVAVRNLLADDYQQLGMYEQAAPLLQKNLRTLEKTIGGDNIVLAGVLNSLGQLHYRLSNNSGAEQLFRRCLSIQEKTVGVNGPAYAATINNLALVLIEQGKDQDVSAMYKDAVTALDKSIGKNSPLLATVLLNWAVFSRSLGNLEVADSLIAEAAAIRDKAFGKDHPATAEIAEEYARLQCERGNFKHALYLVSLAHSIKTNFFGRDHPAMADTISTAADVYAGLGDEYTAAELYGSSALISAKVFGGDHPMVANKLEAAGLALCRAGEYEEAVRPFLTALRSQRDYLVAQAARANGEDRLRLAGKMFYRTELFHSLCALSFSNAAVSLPLKGAEQLASCKALLEEVQSTQASLETDSRTSTRELRGKFEEAQNQLDRLPESNLDPELREARRRQLQNVKAQMEDALAQWNGLVAQAIRERNLTLPDIARSLPLQSALVDFIQYERYDFATKTNQWKEQRYAAYLTFPLARDSTNVVVTRVDLGEAAPINDAVQVISRRMSAGQYAAKDVLPALQRLSQLVYAPLAPYLTNIAHLIICPDGQLNRLPFEALPCGHNGNRFLIEEKTISYVTSGREVVRLASGQANSKLKMQNSKSLVMGNPDFDLDLRSSRREEALTRSSQLSTNNSQPGDQSLLTSAATRALSRDARGLRFNPLPGSGIEATNVANLLGGDATLRLGANAREAELKAVVSPRVLHLATHGFFLSDQEFKHTNSGRADLLVGWARQRVPTTNDWENPMVRCGIALAGANHTNWPTGRAGSPLPTVSSSATNGAHGVTRPTIEDEEDGLLTGLEASLLNLQGTELVILSACDSGSGEVKIGEGVMSLRRAFRIAGAEAVLASHWPVNDKATSQLMTEFMRRWRAGEPRAKAWREAQLSLQRSKEFSNPYFWAAFTLTGQWD